MTEGLRAYDVCARWGGEEFMVLLPEISGPSALEIANRLRLKVNTLQAPELPTAMQISVSIGIAEHRSEGLLEDTIKRADLAFYQAKCSGRDRIALAE